MKVNLELQEDAQLRAAIKDMIKGQITSIYREVSKQMLETHAVKTAINNQVRVAIREIVEKQCDSLNIRKIALEIVKDVVIENMPKTIAIDCKGNLK